MTTPIPDSQPSTSSAPPPSPLPPSVKVRRHDCVGRWEFPKNVNEACGICQNQLQGQCIECEAAERDCNRSFGQCGHGYHSCCINSWKEGKSDAKCPQCFAKWVTESEEAIN